MAEYIEREKVIEDIGELFTLCYETLPNECGHHFIVEKELKTHLDFVRNLPAANVKPIVRGKWTLNKDGSGTCSVCGHKQNNCWDVDNWDNFCHFCGADFRQH